MNKLVLSLGLTAFLGASLMVGPANAGVETPTDPGERQAATKVVKSTDKQENPKQSQTNKEKAKAADKAEVVVSIIKALNNVPANQLNLSFNDPNLPQQKKPAANSSSAFKVPQKPAPASTKAKLPEKTVRGVLLDVSTDRIYVKHKPAKKSLSKGARLTAAGINRLFESAKALKITSYSLKKLGTAQVKTLEDIVLEVHEFVIVTDADGTEYVTDIR